ncbi:MAG: hypothetical protein R2864_07400 [Syntrophotaleaceae bacterium]
MRSRTTARCCGSREVPGTRRPFGADPVGTAAGLRQRPGQDLRLEAASKDPAELSGEERALVVNSFFSVQEQRHIQPRPLPPAGAVAGRQPRPRRRAARFQLQDLLRDLRVWFLLAWSGHYLHGNRR